MYVSLDNYSYIVQITFVTSDPVTITRLLKNVRLRAKQVLGSRL